MRLVAVAAPSAGVTRVGLVVRTIAPDAPLAAKPSAVMTPAPNPLMPVATGNPVQFTKLPEIGVPNTGVVNVLFVKRRSLRS